MESEETGNSKENVPPLRRTDLLLPRIVEKTGRYFGRSHQEYQS